MEQLLIFFITFLSFYVMFVKNIIQSVLCLIMVFLISTILFIYIGADFIGLIILIVYIGAIAVLFLFIIMMLNIRLYNISSIFRIYLPLGIFLSMLFLFQIIYLFYKIFFIIFFDNIILYFNWILYINKIIISIGHLLYNIYFIFFIGVTFLLFVAMIGAILLALEDTSLVDNKSYRLIESNVNWKYIK